jgi:hypothetical protein
MTPRRNWFVRRVEKKQIYLKALARFKQIGLNIAVCPSAQGPPAPDLRRQKAL